MTMATATFWNVITCCPVRPVLPQTHYVIYHTKRRHTFFLVIKTCTKCREHHITPYSTSNNSEIFNSKLWYKIFPLLLQGNAFLWKKPNTDVATSSIPKSRQRRVFPPTSLSDLMPATHLPSVRLAHFRQVVHLIYLASCH
jgi:hypothetical protein